VKEQQTQIGEQQSKIQQLLERIAALEQEMN
jgi:cell division protein FtsB